MFKKSFQTFLLLFMGSSVLNAQCPTPDAGPDQTICVGTDITFGATLPVSFIGAWVKGNPGIFGFGADQGTLSDAASPTSTVTNLNNSGSQLFIWTLDDGASCQIRDTMVLYVQEPVTSANAGNNVEVCAGGTATLLAGGLSTGDVGTWSKLTGVNSGNTSFADINDKNTEVTGFFATGNDTLRWTVTNLLCGGSEYDDVVITVNSIPSTALAGNDQQVCQGDTVQLLGSIATVGIPKWTLPNGSGAYFIPDGNNDSVNLDGGTAGGDIKVAYQISNSSNPTILNACLSVDTVVINFGPSKANAGSDQSICGSTAAMAAKAAEAGETGMWTIVKQTGSEVITSPTSPTTTITGITSDTLTLRWTLTSGACTDADDVDLFLLGDLPSAAIAGADFVACEGDTLQFIGSNPTSGMPMWTKGEPSFIDFLNFAYLTDENNDSVSVAVLRDNTYKFYYTVSVGGASTGNCVSTDSLEVLVNPVPNANAGANQSSCVGVSTYTVTGNRSPGETGVWSKVSGAGTVTQVDTIVAVVSGVTAGSTVLAWTLDNGNCTDVDNMTITVGSPSTAVAGASQTICKGDSLQLNGSIATNGNPAWSIPDGQSSFSIACFCVASDNLSPQNGLNDTVGVKIDVVGTYMVYYSISLGAGEGCTSTDSLTITVDDCVTGIDENQSSSLSVSIQPNPASDFVNISLKDSQTGAVSISIRSMDGRIVFSEDLGVVTSFNKVIDLSGISSGVYVLRTIKGGSSSTIKLIVQ